MHDAVQLERLATPATVVVTEPFQGLAATVSASLGVPGYHAVVVPHPVASRGDERLRALARSVAEITIGQLTTEGAGGR